MKLYRHTAMGISVFTGGLLVSGAIGAQVVDRDAPKPAEVASENPTGAADAIRSGSEEEHADQSAALRDEALIQAFQRVYAGTAGGLTAESVAKDALRVAPSLDAEKARIAATKARVSQTVAEFYPKVSVRASYTRLSAVDGSLGGSGASVGALNEGPLQVAPCASGVGECVVDSAGIPVAAVAAGSFSIPQNRWAVTGSLTVPISDYLLRWASATKAAKASTEAARWSQKAAERNAATNGVLAYYEWARALGRIAVADYAIKQSLALREDTETRFIQGTATRADVMRVKSKEAQAQRGQIEARSLEQRTRAQLSILLKRSATGLALGEDLLKPPVSGNADLQLDELIQVAFRDRPELKLLGANKQGIEYGKRATDRARLPTLEAFGDLTHANPSQNSFLPGGGWGTSWQVGAAVTWSLDSIARNGAISHEYAANIQELDAEREQLRDSIRKEVTDAYWAEKQVRASLAASILISNSAAEALRVSKELYQAGTGTTFEVTETEVDLVDALLTRIDAYIDLRVTKARLIHATGMDVVAAYSGKS